MKVSVITACLNAASHIETALKSVRDQIYPDIEHVIIDGGSTDGTLDIIDRHRERVAYLVSEPDRGIYNAMNKGIKAATGDVLFFLNADDRFADERVVADVAPVFEQRPDLEIVYGNLSWQLADRILKHKQPSMITKEYLASRTVLHQTVFAQRQAFSATNGFSEKYRVVSDYEWMLKVFLRDKRNYQYVDRTVAAMDTQGRSWTTKWENERIRVMLKHFSPRDILRYRVWPRQKKAWEPFGRTAKRKMLQLIGRKVWMATFRGDYSIDLNYPTSASNEPRWGYGKPPHPILYELINRKRDNYARLLSRFLDYRDAYVRINAYEDKEEPSIRVTATNSVGPWRSYAESGAGEA